MWILQGAWDKIEFTVDANDIRIVHENYLVGFL